MQYKNLPLEIFEVKKVKQSDNDEVGVFFGAMATETLDRANDVIAPDAFDESLSRYKLNDRPIRLFYQHNTHELPIGVIPISSVTKDGTKWNVKGELNLDTQRGRETYSLLKQRALSDMSIGFTILDEGIENGVNIIKKLELWEASIVSEPMNPDATVVEVKGATSFADLPLAPRTMRWNASAATGRVRELTDSVEKPSATYKKAFLWFDGENADKFGSYKLPFADVVDGTLKAVPRAIFNAAARLDQTDISESDKEKVATHINRYYKKMGLESPLKNAELAEHYKIFTDVTNTDDHNVDITKFVCMKDIENYLRDSTGLSGSQRKLLISKIKSFSRDVDNDKGERDVRDNGEENLEFNIEQRLDSIIKLFEDK